MRQAPCARRRVPGQDVSAWSRRARAGGQGKLQEAPRRARSTDKSSHRPVRSTLHVRHVRCTRGTCTAHAWPLLSCAAGLFHVRDHACRRDSSQHRGRRGVIMPRRTARRGCTPRTRRGGPMDPTAPGRCFNWTWIQGGLSSPGKERRGQKLFERPHACSGTTARQAVDAHKAHPPGRRHKHEPQEAQQRHA